MRSPYAIGVLLIPIIMGTFGPYTSASMSPTLYPSAASATARFTETVVLPTPPLPEPTAIRFWTPGMGSLGCGLGWLGLIWFILTYVSNRAAPRVDTLRSTAELQVKSSGLCVNVFTFIRIIGNLFPGVPHRDANRSSQWC